MRRRTKDSQIGWYSMVGYKLDDPSQIGCLAFNENGQLYQIVNDIVEAQKFPDTNIASKPGFGTPAQWCEFFNKDPDLEGWKFHIVKVQPPARSKAKPIRRIRRDRHEEEKDRKED